MIIVRNLARVVGAVRTGHWPTLLAGWLHFEVSFMAWLLIGALGIPISETLQLSGIQKALLVAVPLLGGAAMRIPVGLACDWIHPRGVGFALLVIETLALVWAWAGETGYLDLLAVGLLLGAAGASFAVVLPLVSRAYPVAHQGLALGVAASANSGTVLVAFLAPRLAAHVGWENVFGLMVVPVVLTAVLYLAMVPSTGTGGPRTPPRPALAALFGQPSLYWLCLLYAVTFGGFVGLCSFLPLLLNDGYGIDRLTAGTITAACGLAGSLIRPLGGYSADRRGGPPLAAGVLGAIIVLLFAMAAGPALPLAVLLMITTVAVMGLGNGVVFRIVADLFGKHMGTASGVIGAAGGFGGFLFPIVLGGLAELTGTYQAGFLLLAGLAGTAWLVAIPPLRRALRPG